MFSTESGWTGLRRALKEAAGVLRKAGDGMLERDGEEEGGEEGELKCSAGGFDEREETGRSDATVPAAMLEEELEEDRMKDAPALVDDMVEL